MKTTTPDPFQTAMEQLQWPWWGTPLVVTVVVLVLAGGIFALVRSAGGNDVDKMQRHLRKGNRLGPVLYPARLKATRKKLHPDVPDLPVGERIGTLVGAGSTWVWQGWRDVATYIFGTGRGKTSALVVRHMLEAPGAAVMTTNKVDGVREVLAGRQHAGEQWLYDPTQVYRHDQRPDFVYNPLDDVRSLTDAQELAAIFEASTKDADSKKDAQFDSQGLDLFAYALLGARLEGKSLRQVFEWIVNHQHSQIAEVMARHGQVGPKLALEGMKNQPDKTRGSVYATAQRMASAIANDDLLAWAMAPGVRKFDPEAFVRSNDTAVLISRNGAGSGGAFVASLVRSIGKAGEREASANGGRVRVPVVFELDEAANVVRWPELPDLVSFYGSLGLVLGVYFQGWSQMVRVFGQAGAEQLWTTSPIRVYGGGEDPLSPFLERFSKGIGTYDEYTTNRSHGPNGSTSSRTPRSKPILPVDVLAHLPEWRAVLSSTAVKPILIQTRPWFEDKVLTAMVNGEEVRNGKIVKQKASTSAPAPVTAAEGGARVEPV
ncbi:type IV secretory system conjugative DNA transfer family protein [Curtobacterium flaccumfaciens]|uniref:type IV secretory system conjugative DNA transfer family protein n=1 Tax=Curtobacterium flaccumfaciens TaxID=2035 RepID=UPI00188B579B|nr:TraM recognition domain-containing protein [Curtobacterium flaccumfaciens]MBF4629326.1 type IV secretory system conjugative DNA transfer family protein [Curtobacterium flaccumfaciens]